MTNRTTLAVAIATLASLITGCASTPNQTTAPQTQAPTVAANETANQPIGEGSFQPATLYSLLVAEMAEQRGMPRVALHNYLQEAKRTHDLGLIQRATQLAAQLRDNEALLQASLLWSEVEPDNPAPFSIATKELIREGKVDQAGPMLEKALKLDSLGVVDTLANRGQSMSDKERQAYLQILDKQLQKDSENPYLLYAKASLLSQQKDFESALKLTQRALNSDPEYDRAILLEADLQARLGHLDTAIGHLREQLGDHEHKQFRILYTRLLMEKHEYTAAEEQADMLAKRYSGDDNLLFYLGVLMLEHERVDASERYFKQLAEQTGPNDAISYYYGRIAELRGNTDQAIDDFSAVADPRYLVSSYTEISNLLNKPEDQSRLHQIFSQARQRTPDASALLYTLEANWLLEQKLHPAAMSLLNEALKAHPNDSRLLYSRAMLFEQQDNIVAMEKDLRLLLKNDPKNASALNALGYTLTDRTNRHQEALGYLKQALKLKPEDPAILDSMGWVQYHLGDLKLSLAYLKRAYEIFPDPEIAAHLGTVYWKLGQHQQALDVWDKALKDHPGHKLLLEAKKLANP